MNGRCPWREPRGSLGALRGDEDGFTLLEVVVAMLLLAIGLIGAATAVSLQVSGGLSSAATTGLGAINRSNVISTATMLAQEKIEQLKHDAEWRGSGSPMPAVGNSPLTADTYCTSHGGTYDSSAGTCTETKVTNFATYSRITTVGGNSTLPGCSSSLTATTCTSRVVTVEVSYIAIGDAGTNYSGKVTLGTIISRRP